MNTDMTRHDARPNTTAHRYDPSIDGAPDQTLEHERAVDAILDDCFLSMGQAVGLRATFDFDAVLWVRNNFRAKFLSAMRHCGNRWVEDRATVTAVCGMLGERAVRYAEGAPSISLAAAMKAAADVERYCQLHASRRSAARPATSSESATAMIAGYWCTWDPEP